MKKVFLGVSFLIMATITCTFWSSCKKDEIKGKIYGTVTDFATGEPVGNANVTLRQTGEATLTGSDGTYEFSDVSSGKYNITVSKTEYTDLIDDYDIVVTDGKNVRRDVQIEKLPSALRILNSSGVDIDTLDFGAEQDVVNRTFSIFNNSPKKITWWIEWNCNWITEVKSMLTNNQSGQIEPGSQEPIKVTIDRDILGVALKTYILNISSDNGSKELRIVAGEDIGLPALTTQPVSNLTQTSVTFNGTIENEGTPSYTERGFVYSTTAQPTIENNHGRITSAVNNQHSFSANVSGLVSNESYYVRAYAINTIGVAYGNDVHFTTGSVQTEVSTSAVTNISASSATLNGTIIEEGSPAYTERGFCYAKTGTPTISNNKIVVSGSGTGAYSTSVSSLEYQTTYYARAYAIQNGQTVYGNIVSFSTSWTNTQVQTSAASSISASSATFNGTIVNEGSPAYTEKGFCYSSSTSSPTITNNKITVTGTGSGNYSKNVTGLEYQTTYYVRAYAMQNGQPIYGSVVNFTTIWTDAQVQTSAVSNITTTSAKFNGNVLNAGTPAITEKGFCYDKYSSQPTINNNKVQVGTSGTGTYSTTRTGLEEGETYYVRAYVMQDGEPIYGDAVSFTTTANPVVRTLDVSGLTAVSSDGFLYTYNVTFNGYVESVGNPAYVERGFCYGTSSNPTSNRQVVSGSGTGSFSKTITGLSGRAVYPYYVRAYVKTSSGTYIYGDNVMFYTDDAQ